MCFRPCSLRNSTQKRPGPQVTFTEMWRVKCENVSESDWDKGFYHFLHWLTLSPLRLESSVTQEKRTTYPWWLNVATQLRLKFNEQQVGYEYRIFQNALHPFLHITLHHVYRYLQSHGSINTIYTFKQT